MHSLPLCFLSPIVHFSQHSATIREKALLSSFHLLPFLLPVFLWFGFKLLCRAFVMRNVLYSSFSVVLSLLKHETAPDFSPCFIVLLIFREEVTQHSFATGKWGPVHSAALTADLKALSPRTPSWIRRAAAASPSQTMTSWLSSPWRPTWCKLVLGRETPHMVSNKAVPEHLFFNYCAVI